MKINSGLFRNTSIEILKNSSFRPTTSISRKSFFDTIGSLEGKLFLDLFAGSGIVGFEAASRGAKNVTFVEMNRRYLNQIITNSKKFEYDQFNFMARDALRFIKKSDSAKPKLLIVIGNKSNADANIAGITPAVLILSGK